VSRRCTLWFTVLLAASLACEKPAPPRQADPALVVLELPPDLGAAERPAVLFDHARHTAALGMQHCTPCHSADHRGRPLPRLAGTDDLEDIDAAREAYHAVCLDCHERRLSDGERSGPVTCGECHLRQALPASGRSPIHLDRSLHARHVIAEQDRCESCHHVYSEKARKLVSGKGRESACADCHGTRDVDRVPSLRNAVHLSCVGCHLERAGFGESGPVRCAGCHDAETRKAIERLSEIPRLMRGQPDLIWIQARGDATARAVYFDHERHESVSDRCSVCHHQTLKPCGECHTLLGDPGGNGVTLSQAHHSTTSERSCIGCHRARAMSDSDCASCHHLLPSSRAGTACRVCHRGPSPVDAAGAPRPRELPQLPELPESSDRFPEEVVIESLADRYRPARVPHRDVAAFYLDLVGGSRLARRFHGATPVPCQACHHHSPVGERPPPCSSCHGPEAGAGQDKPRLEAAYHRQCIGCHQVLGAGTGCTDCHAKAAEKP